MPQRFAPEGNLVAATLRFAFVGRRLVRFGMEETLVVASMNLFVSEMFIKYGILLVNTLLATLLV